MDKRLVELFMHHPSTKCFDRNPWDAFHAVIAGEEYRLDRMPWLIGLYGGWFTIMFHLGELSHMLCFE